MAKLDSEYSSSSSSSLLVLLLLSLGSLHNVLGGQVIKVDVGLILDKDTIVGKMTKTCMDMALEDFYATNHNFTTRLVLHPRDSKTDVVEAAYAAIDLLKNVRVQAILGPQSSTQAEFVINIGNKTQVPVISLATSPFLSPKENPYFIRAAPIASAQIGAVVSIIKTFSWRQIVLIYEDNSYGSGILPHLIDALLPINTQVRYQSVISLSATDDYILGELYKLQTIQTRVFVVHMLLPLASRLFLKVKEVGMMRQGYVWIITDAITSLLDSMDPTHIEAMQGVIGVKTYVPRSKELDEFRKRWRKRFIQENPDIEHECELNIYGLWAYSSVKALAMATEKAQISKPKFWKPNTNGENWTDLDVIGASEMGPMLLQSIRNMRFNDLSGEFNLVDGELQSSTFQIVNVIGKRDWEVGFWTPKYGISKHLMPDKDSYTTNKDDLIKPIIWPGESYVVPKGWEMTAMENRLRVGVPVGNAFYGFIKVEKHPQTNDVIAIGFCVDVFKEVMDHLLPYAIQYEFIPFVSPGSNITISYDELVYQIALDKFDVVVGDVTIKTNRSKFVDFTMPFTESGVAMIVPIKDDESKNAWIFMKPLTMDMWLIILALFIFIGFVVWVLEHRVNKEFRGPPLQQVGMIFWFSFSTLVFAHMTSSYTASLTSMLTVQKLQPTITNINDLIKSGDYVGYPEGSYIGELLKSMGFDPSKVRAVQAFNEALSKGSTNGGVAAIVDEIPYLRLFLSKYCSKYVMVGPTHNSVGFGFAFAKGSPLVPDVSRGILSLKEGEKMNEIIAKWFSKDKGCIDQNDIRVTFGSLTVKSFKGLFLIIGVSSLFAFIVFISNFLYENKTILASNCSIRQKVAMMVSSFDKRKDGSSDRCKKPIAVDEGMAISTIATTAICGDKQ
ncbi:glutamate receptor 2.7-like isoform X1 [Diospyros lotus]|uniref:glutamate receptor 2.7-like isoform X1 n=1 Tax=Diospyros lotus TaxID=55363 RepID=UPI00225489B2|nr:glutamate receptor 2.7-like isoform X1 [Diospyros lotus]